MEPVVTLAQGRLLGSSLTTSSGFSFNSFTGIPYAEPPIGALRFKDPLPPKPWTGIRDAKKEGNVCSQINNYLLLNKTYTGSEDCLYLNVYTPTLSPKLGMLLPVMFFIHGGGFFIGSGNSDVYGPDYLIEENVVLVTINYRLGILGFLSLGISEVSGNAGLKDMTMALKWVKENIEHFGGDGNTITIFGESAGGSAVEYLCLSKVSNYLFQKAIAQSGSCLNQWAHSRYNVDPILKAREVALKLSKKDMIGSEYEILDILRNSTSEELVSAALRSRSEIEILSEFPFPFSPVIEKDFPGSFLSESFEVLAQKERFNQIIFMSGYTNKEGILYWFPIFENPKLLEIYNNNFEYFVPYDMGYSFGSNESKLIAAEMKEFYFRNESLTLQTVDKYFDLMTDNAFLYLILKSIKTNLGRRTVYFYKLSFDGDLNYFKKYLNCTFDGTSHEDDLGYLFKIVNPPLETFKYSDSAMMRRRMVKLWTNFAKFGNPTPKADDLLTVQWKAVNSADELNYLRIEKDMKMDTNPELERMQFWEKLYRKYKKIC